ncbi:MAG: M28 family peptidase, partial [Clostridia bacterium]|nr:M28 family peptidase [Clostridia bacterium]
RQLKGQKLAHDIVLVAFGSGTADYAGAKAFVQGLGAADLARTDAMYNIDGIYAGDEVYVHAGQNSVLAGDRKNYELRRKLYEATDVFFENKLFTNNQYNLLTNQSSIRVPLGDTGETAIYREWSLHRSDHTPFDEAGIPVVFFESYDYNHKSVDEMKESKNPTLAATDGQIRDTAFDSTAFLSYLLTNTVAASPGSSGTEKETVDRLTQRINNTAFVILEAIKRSSAVTTAATTTEE